MPLNLLSILLLYHEYIIVQAEKLYFFLFGWNETLVKIIAHFIFLQLFFMFFFFLFKEKGYWRKRKKKVWGGASVSWQLPGLECMCNISLEAWGHYKSGHKVRCWAGVDMLVHRTQAEAAADDDDEGDVDNTDAFE